MEKDNIITPVNVLVKTYITLLLLPMSDEWRINNQRCYAELRCMISRNLNISEQSVQDFCEAYAIDKIKYFK
jgi:hypothetical protein